MKRYVLFQTMQVSNSIFNPKKRDRLIL